MTSFLFSKKKYTYWYVKIVTRENDIVDFLWNKAEQGVPGKGMKREEKAENGTGGKSSSVRKGIA